MTTKLDLTKPIRTRCGLPARIYATDGGWTDVDGVRIHCIHGAVLRKSVGWQIDEWHENGRIIIDDEHAFDLVNVEDDNA